MASPSVDEQGEVWLDSATAALVLGCSAQYLGRLALAGRLPGRREGHGRTAPWRFRRRDIEQRAAARLLPFVGVSRTTLGPNSRESRAGRPSVNAQPAGDPRPRRAAPTFQALWMRASHLV